MGDIANKEQAEKCRDLGKDFMRQGDHEKAARFFAKSLRMYALPGVSELRDKAEELHRRGSAAPSSGGSTPKTSSGASGGGSSRPAQPQQSRPAPASPAASASASASAGTATGAGDRPYTPEQESGAARIVTLSKKCYYQTLSISKRADEVEIKKAYRKLALKFHPDKNSAPSAEAAFKALNAAMETLSDPNKRQVYDDMGHEGAQQVNNGGGGGGGGFGGRHPNDLSPEDLMNMFFGGGMGGSFGGGGFRTYNFGGGPRMRRATRQHQQQQQQHRAEEPDNGGGGGLGQLFQLIPMLLLLLSMTGFFSGGAAGNNPWSKPFALHKEHPYNIQRFTASYGITKDIPYFVTDSFRTTYAASKGDLRRAEAQVEQDFKTDLYNRCDREKKHKARQIYEAKRVRNQEAQQEALKKADGLETKSCDDFFNKWKFSRY